jgi:hypothetical protein
LSLVHKVSLSNIVVSGFTRHGVSVSGVSASVSNLTVSQIGCSGISVYGGSTRWLTPSHIVVANSDISNYARLTRCYNPGVAFDGVGIRVAHNMIRNAPHNGLLGGGNDHVFEGNRLSRLCYGSRDAGAFYIGRSWIARGGLLLDNTFQDIAIYEPTYLGSFLVSAIYWDDEQSGVTARGNACIDSMNCFLLGGGRDNAIVGNSCENMQTYCVYFDNRGMNWQKSACTVTPPGILVQQLYSVNYTQPPYSVAYPPIVSTLQDRPCVPVGNVVSNNTCTTCKLGFLSQSTATISSWGSTAANNTEH